VTFFLRGKMFYASLFHLNDPITGGKTSGGVWDSVSCHAAMDIIPTKNLCHRCPYGGGGDRYRRVVHTVAKTFGKPAGHPRRRGAAGSKISANCPRAIYLPTWRWAIYVEERLVSCTHDCAYV